MTVRSNQVVFVLAGLLCLTSCVPNRKVVLLQKNDVNVKNLPKDSVVRHYKIDSFQYKIQSNDIISVRFTTLTNKDFDFFNVGAAPNVTNIAVGGAQLIGELVDDSGEIPLPVLGKVKVAGLTVFEAQKYLQQLAGKYVDSPIVKVRLLNYRITMLGEVNREGTVSLSNNRVSLIEAIGQAGGFSEYADRSNIKLIRQKGYQTEVLYVNILSEDFFNSPYYFVNQNDVLIVPPLRQRTFKKYFTTNLALIVSIISVSFILINITK